MKPKPPTCVLLLCLAVAAAARAEVTDSADHGFTLRIERRITASPTETWTRLVDEVGAWWHPDHTFSGNAGNLSIDARAQGCFCEQLEPEGEGRHLTVVFAQPGKRLRLTGGLGPLQGYGLAGSLNFELEPDGEGTRLRVIETGFQDLEGPEEDRARHAAENTEGWEFELGQLRDYVAEQVGGTAAS